MISPTDEDARFASEQLATGCDRMELLLKGLLHADGTVAEEVHAIRKLGKSLRGGFSLFRLGDTAAKEIQGIGRLLSSPRDAVSRLGTWQKIAWDGDHSTAAAITGLLAQQTHSAASRPPPETISWCIERVTGARGTLLELPADTLPERMASGILKLRKQVTKRCRHLDARAEDDFHDARKALKAYLGALGFLPEGMIAKNPTMEELAELLGDENDIATLSTWLERHGFTRDFVPDLWKSLKNRRKEIRRRAMRDAVTLVSRGGGN